MKNKANFKTLHIGSMIKEIAMKKDISSKKLASVIPRDKNNFDKIYHVNDMDCDNMVKISYMMEYNFLKVISEKCLSHIPVVEKDLNEKKYYNVLPVRTACERKFACKRCLFHFDGLQENKPQCKNAANYLVFGGSNYHM